MRGLILDDELGHPEALTGLEQVGGYLCGTWDPPAGSDGPPVVGDGSWTALIGRMGAVALRAAAASTRDEHREALLGLLEVWAGTPLADPTVRLRTGGARAEAGAVRGEAGATIATGRPYGDRCVVLQARFGEADPPEFGEPTGWVEVERGWGDREQLRRLVALVRERGPMAWDPGAAGRLSKQTGVSRAGAALLLIGDAGGMRFTEPLDRDQCRLLGLKPAETEAGYDELGWTGNFDRLDLLARVLPEDPAELWEPAGPTVLADRIGAAWRTRYGRSDPAPEASLAVVAELAPVDWAISAADVCSAFLSPQTHPLAGRDHDTWLTEAVDGVRCSGEDENHLRFKRFLVVMAGTLPVVYAELPAGDPVRAGLPATVAALRARLDHPRLLLPADHTPYLHRDLDRLRGAFGKRPYAGPVPLTAASFDDGLTVATIEEPTERSSRTAARVHFRPAHYGDDERSALLREVVPEPSAVRHAVDVLRGDWCTRVLERVADDTLPVGGYESNPALSAPETVTRVEQALGVSADAAALYLQLLALPRPADRRVRRWNGWNIARHRQAAAALVAAGVVITGKRPHAGRELFLPCVWAKAHKPQWPMETWKADLLGIPLHGRKHIWGDLTWRLTLPELFAHAWDLVERGDGPGWTRD
ncbi:hypothetical protein B4N89_00230 [Embleya scabrispora]|uniref:DNA-binding protein n=1 Tax=Embleya scabrispora TaxID=159449 RepID=A0A1T3NSA9_9ACTN|nr:hypothetical protein B4N89_00230 [Embleya scabrispora]